MSSVYTRENRELKELRDVDESSTKEAKTINHSNNSNNNNMSSSSLEDPFVLIEKGNAMEVSQNNWGASDFFSKAFVVLEGLSLCSNQPEKIVQLYKKESQIYFKKARICFRKALEFEQNQDDLQLAVPLMYMISPGEMEKRMTIFQRLFVSSKELQADKPPPPPIPKMMKSIATQTTDWIENTDTDTTVVKEETIMNEQSLEERLAKLDSSLSATSKTQVTSFQKSDEQRMDDIHNGLAKLGVPIIQSSSSQQQLPNELSEEEQLQEILSMAHDEALLNTTTAATINEERGGDELPKPYIVDELLAKAGITANDNNDSDTNSTGSSGSDTTTSIESVDDDSITEDEKEEDKKINATSNGNETSKFLNMIEVKKKKELENNSRSNEFKMSHGTNNDIYKTERMEQKDMMEIQKGVEHFVNSITHDNSNNQNNGTCNDVTQIESCGNEKNNNGSIQQEEHDLNTAVIKNKSGTVTIEDEKDFTTALEEQEHTKEEEEEEKLTINGPKKEEEENEEKIEEKDLTELPKTDTPTAVEETSTSISAATTTSTPSDSSSKL